ncbi:PD-(D/E)XK motif protein [Erysipelothrix rhusiopathiae]|uniref:PD-(D/E)XK motif protein n=1 Tax=Erysipelothrix rhusiopathiae TaxID=1648 RepID=UPI002FBD6BF4
MTIVDEIRENFASQFSHGLRTIKTADEKSWTIRESNYYGVAIMNINNLEINEQFSNVRLFSSEFQINGGERINLLILSSELNHLRNEFAIICAQFLEPGENKENRILLQTEPFEWWKKWRDLLGNSIKHKKIYDVIGELYCALFLLESKEKNLIWQGPSMNSHDIETETISLDVKTTLIKYAETVTISGQFQLQSNKTLYIYMCKLEESSKGNSIDDLLELIVTAGGRRSDYEEKISQLGYRHGSRDRKIKYRKLEGKRYLVDTAFPAITPSSFVSGKIPDNITKIEYTIDLVGIPNEIW